MARKRSVASLTSGVLVATLAIGVSAADDSEASPAPDPSASPNPDDLTIEWLYVQSAGSGTLEDNGDGTYALTLEDVAEETLAFSDTPDRYVEVLSTAQIAFEVVNADDKPNAALQLGADSAAVLTLEDATYDSDAGTMSYTTTLVTNDPYGDSVSLGDLPAGPFEDPQLFIDDAQYNGYAGPLGVGAKCWLKDTWNKATTFWCWQINKGEEDWPDMYPKLKVTFKNTGEGRVFVRHCEVFFQHNYMDPGGTASLTLSGSQGAICGGWDKEDASKDGKVMKFEITGFEEGSD